MKIGSISSTVPVRHTYGSRVDRIKSPSSQEVKTAMENADKMEADFQEVQTLRKQLRTEFPNPENKTFQDLLEESFQQKSIEQELEEDGFVLDIHSH